MRRSMLWSRASWAAPTVGLIAAGAVIACTGGGGSLDDRMMTYDSPPSYTEHAENSRESAPGFVERPPASQERTGNSTEPGPGAQGATGSGVGGAFSCAGTYTCVEPGDKDGETLVLSVTNGACGIVIGNKSLILAADGTILINGKVAGSWQSTGDGFTATTSDGSVTCTRGATQGSSSGSSGKSSSSSSGGSSGITVTIDGGTRLDGG